MSLKALPAQGSEISSAFRIYDSPRTAIVLLSEGIACLAGFSRNPGRATYELKSSQDKLHSSHASLIFREFIGRELH
jgi:hypothetical protein